MSEVGVRELKNQTSAVIERVEGGEVVTVTRRGRPVARLVPARMPPRLADLIAAGRASWSGRKPELPTPVKPSGSGKAASDYVIEGRGPREG